MAASGSVGGVDRDILSTPSAGEHAFIMGVLRVASGLYETHLVVSWSPTEASSLSEAQRLGADPYFHRRLPLDETTSAALQASALAARMPSAVEAADRIARRNRDRGARAAGTGERPPWPLAEGMVPPPVTGAVAMVLASEGFVASRGIENAAWLRGMGWATETGFLGDRDLARAPALEEAARRAFEEAGITGASAVDVLELTSATPYQEILIAETLGIAEATGGGQDGPAVDPSGGVAALNPVFCIGAIRIAEAANQVRGRAGAHQVRGAGTALAHAASGFAMMYQAVLVFGADREGAQA